MYQRCALGSKVCFPTLIPILILTLVVSKACGIFQTVLQKCVVELSVFQNLKLEMTARSHFKFIKVKVFPVMQFSLKAFLRSCFQRILQKFIFE